MAWCKTPEMEDDERKRRKAEPEVKSWFSMFVEMESKLTSRIFAAEQRIKELEEKLGITSPWTWKG